MGEIKLAWLIEEQQVVLYVESPELDKAIRARFDDEELVDFIGSALFARQYARARRNRTISDIEKFLQHKAP